MFKQNLKVMSLIKRNNLMFPSMMSDIFRPDWFGGIENYNTSVPAVNIRDNEDNYVIELAIPGQKKEDFNVEIDNHIMTISMESKSEDEVVENNYSRREFAYSAFTRSFNLPETINEDKIDASYIDGILRFTLPVKEEALPKPKRMIPIGK
jgi:HSP20 family protein